MNYIRNFFADSRLRAKITKLVRDCVGTDLVVKHGVTECGQLADEHPVYVLTALAETMGSSRPQHTLSALCLLEYLVGTCNHAFHLALAQHTAMQERLLSWTTRRTENDAQRQAQRLARLTVLEYSRMFMDDPQLAPLAGLAEEFTRRTNKNLMRCINLQKRKVTFREPRSGDFFDVSPQESRGTSSQPMHEVRRIDLRAPEVWRCPACHCMNAPAAHKCVACETVRLEPEESVPRGTVVHSSRTEEKEEARLAAASEDPVETHSDNVFAPSAAEHQQQQQQHVDPAVGSSTTSPLRDGSVFTAS